MSSVVRPLSSKTPGAPVEPVASGRARSGSHPRSQVTAPSMKVPLGVFCRGKGRELDSGVTVTGHGKIRLRGTRIC